MSSFRPQSLEYDLKEIKRLVDEITVFKWLKVKNESTTIGEPVHHRSDLERYGLSRLSTIEFVLRLSKRFVKESHKTIDTERQKIESFIKEKLRISNNLDQYENITRKIQYLKEKLLQNPNSILYLADEWTKLTTSLSNVIKTSKIELHVNNLKTLDTQLNEFESLVTKLNKLMEDYETKLKAKGFENDREKMEKYHEDLCKKIEDDEKNEVDSKLDRGDRKIEGP